MIESKIDLVNSRLGSRFGFSETTAIGEFAEHYNAERNHQGIGNELIDPTAMSLEGKVIRDERLGGLLSFYRRAA